MTRSLIKLALDETVDARRRLFSQVAEMVAANLPERTDRELAIFSEVILELYSLASPEDRIRLAVNLSNCPNTPHALARRLAEDDIAVATPLLANSPVFSQEDLLNFIERLSNAHLQVIARRPDLSTDVSDRLAKKGDLRVQRILAGNREIRLSRPTMLRFVELGANDVELRDMLTNRPDLPPSVCRALLPLVDKTRRKRLRDIIEASLSQEQLDQINRLKSLRREFGQALENPDVALLWRDAARAHITLDELMILLLQDNRFNHAIELLSTKSRTAFKPFKDAVFAGKLDQVMRISAKAELSAAVFAMFAKSRCRHLKLPSAQASDWSSAYAKLLGETEQRRQHRSAEFQARRKDRSAMASGPRKPRPATP